MRGIELGIFNDQGFTENNIEYAYLTRVLESHPGKPVYARIPNIDTEVSLYPIDVVENASVSEGCLWDPHYVMKLTKTIVEGESLRTCLKIKKL